MIPIGLTSATSANPRIHKEKMINLEIVKSLEHYKVLLKTITKSIENETSEQRGAFLVCSEALWVLAY